MDGHNNSDSATSQSMAGYPAQIQNQGLGQLPIELMTRIFKFCLYPPALLVGSIEEPSGSYLPYTFSPLHLGAVCAKWRDVAWDIPQLWESVLVPLSSRLFSSSAGFTIVKEWLERTKTRPLFITVYQRPGYNPDMDQLLPVIELINSYSSRWKVMDILLPSALIVQFKQRLRNGNGPSDLLESLRLGISDMNDIATSHNMIQMWDLSPKDLWIGGIRFESLGIGWSNLTTLLACELYSDEIVQILVECPRLTCCTLQNVRYRHEFRITRPGHPFPHVHTALKFLSFEPRDLEACDLFFDVTLPSLENMRFGWPGRMNFQTNTRFLNIITRCLERSSFPLKSLCLILPRASAFSILYLLHSTPFLTELAIWRGFSRDLWSDVFNHLGKSCNASGCTSVTNTQDVLLPRLKYLTHYQPEHGGAAPENWDVILDVLEASVNGGSTFISNLAKFYITYEVPLDELRSNFENLDQRNLERLAKLIVDGVPLEIRGSDPQLPMLDLIQIHESVKAKNKNKKPISKWLKKFQDRVASSINKFKLEEGDGLF